MINISRESEINLINILIDQDIISGKDLANIKKVSTPIGVIGVIYESRPNVTSDVSALCFKSGNVVILRGGSEAFHSNKILSKLFRRRENRSIT